MIIQEIPTHPLRLHVGGVTQKRGWKTLNIQEPADYVGCCTDLSMIDDESVEQIYASHVLEHLSYQRDLSQALSEFHRVLEPGGELMISVPDLDVLCRMLIAPMLDVRQQFYVMRVMMGGQLDEHDQHRTGFNRQILNKILVDAGFHPGTRLERFEENGKPIFNDCSTLEIFGCPVSLNMLFYKPM